MAVSLLSDGDSRADPVDYFHRRAVWWVPSISVKRETSDWATWYFMYFSEIPEHWVLQYVPSKVYCFDRGILRRGQNSPVNLYQPFFYPVCTRSGVLWGSPVLVFPYQTFFGGPPSSKPGFGVPYRFYLYQPFFRAARFIHTNPFWGSPRTLFWGPPRFHLLHHCFSRRAPLSISTPSKTPVSYINPLKNPVSSFKTLFLHPRYYFGDPFRESPIVPY